MTNMPLTRQRELNSMTLSLLLFPFFKVVSQKWHKGRQLCRIVKSERKTGQKRQNREDIFIKIIKSDDEDLNQKRHKGETYLQSCQKVDQNGWILRLSVSFFFFCFERFKKKENIYKIKMTDGLRSLPFFFIMFRKEKIFTRFKNLVVWKFFLNFLRRQFLVFFCLKYLEKRKYLQGSEI